MEITASGQAGVFAVRRADVVGRSELGRATIHCPPMAEKIALSWDWDLAKNERIVLKDLVRVSNLPLQRLFLCIVLLL